MVGCAIFRRLALGGARARAARGGADILAGASKGNSALLHTGFDAPHGQPRARLHAGRLSRVPGHPRAAQPAAARNRRRRRRLDRRASSRSSPPSSRRRMPTASPTCVQIDRNELRTARTESRSGRARRRAGAGRARHRSLVRAARLCASGAGAWRVRSGAAARSTGGELDGRALAARHDAGRHHRRASSSTRPALYGDLIEAIARPSPFTITPRKGQFVVFDKPAVTPGPVDRAAGADRAHQGRRRRAEPPSAICSSARPPRTRTIATTRQVDHDDAARA